MKLKIFIILSILSFSSYVNAEVEMTVNQFPPVIIKTIPVAGSTNVKSSLSEIQVTFSKEMITDKMWSVMIVKEGMFPEIVGDLKYNEDKRTFVMPVKLLPNKTYAMQFNGNKKNFKCTSGHSAQTYLLTFKTE